jgi:phosphoribosylanthranilate isomerase
MSDKIDMLEFEIVSLKQRIKELERLYELFQSAYIQLHFDYEELRIQHVKMFDEKRFGKLDHQSE